MKFLLIDQNAANELVSDRVLQADTFDQGALLAAGLKSGKFDAGISRRLSFVELKGGVYILSRDHSDNSLLFDLVQCPLFRDLSNDRCLVILQRTARFALKLWNNLRFSACEHVSTESKKAVVFPFPFTTHSSFRVVIERDPMLRKASSALGQTLLVFGAGVEDGLGASVQPDTKLACDALTGIHSARGMASTAASKSPASTEQVLRVTELSSPDSRRIASLSFSQWMACLTRTQRDFVVRPLAGPERIDGPAGTGKTLCLILKCLNLLRESKDRNMEHHAVFIAHSEATRRSVASTFATLDETQLLQSDRKSADVSLCITTLQEWSANLLGQHLSEAELLDRDAMSSKELQSLHILEALQDTKRLDLPSHRKLISQQFEAFLDAEDEWRVAEMLRHEIGVTIKGRAGENWERYRQLEGIRYNLPLQSDGDKGFVFAVFNRYRDRLGRTGQFDTDDVVLSALGQLDTPLWRRRRSREGFDSMFLDETHLFNLNELSIFHHLTRGEGKHPIAFSIDRAQAVGDRALTDDAIGIAIADGPGSVRDATRISTMFRCAPAILNAAQSVTASGATLFTNHFEDPLHNVGSAFTAEEEARSSTPRYFAVPGGDLECCAFERAESLSDELGCPRSSIAVVCFSSELYKRLLRYAKDRNKPIQALERRGDSEVVRQAQKGNLFLLTAPEYIGGLEFDAVLLVGVDELRVPPSTGSKTMESRHFLEYAAHSLLYVAITRARFRVEIFGDRASRPSKLMSAAIRDGLISVDNEIGR